MAVRRVNSAAARCCSQGTEQHKEVLWQPRSVGFQKGKRYAAVIGHAWGAYGQVIANHDTFFASCAEDSDILDIRRHLARNSSVDTNQVYVLGISAGSAIAKNLLEFHPGLWRGAILFSPVAFPDPSKVRVKRILIDYGADDARHNGDGAQLSHFQDEAIRNGIHLSVRAHEGAGHVFNRFGVEHLVVMRGIAEWCVAALNSSGRAPRQTVFPNSRPFHLSSWVPFGILLAGTGIVSFRRRKPLILEF